MPVFGHIPSFVVDPGKIGHTILNKRIDRFAKCQF
jgi:hypothetical protein